MSPATTSHHFRNVLPLPTGTKLPLRGLLGTLRLSDTELLEFVCAVLCANKERMMEWMMDKDLNSIEGMEFSQAMLIAITIATERNGAEKQVVDKRFKGEAYQRCADYADLIFAPAVGPKCVRTPQKPNQRWFPAFQIAEATQPRCHKKTIHRLASREGWPHKSDGNRMLYAPPEELAARIVELFPGPITRRHAKGRKRTANKP
jgi:hypothetical protein